MSIIEIPTYDPCKRPNCPDEPYLEFVSYPPTASPLDRISVVWRILNTDKIPSSTTLLYSMNDSRLNNETLSDAAGGTYEVGDLLYSIIPPTLVTGVLYIRAKAIEIRTIACHWTSQN